MYVTGLTVCDLFLCSPIENYLVEIHLDDNFLIQAISRLESFYFKYLLKRLKTNEISLPESSKTVLMSEKPLSDRIPSPGSNKVKNPLRFVICASVVRPPNASDTKDT